MNKPTYLMYLLNGLVAAIVTTLIPMAAPDTSYPLVIAGGVAAGVSLCVLQVVYGIIRMPIYWWGFKRGWWGQWRRDTPMWKILTGAEKKSDA